MGKRQSQEIEFKWTRDPLFDEEIAQILYEKCLEKLEASVVSVHEILKSKERPFPLSAINLQKIAVSKLKIDSHRVMEIADNLYNKGYISYPRTLSEMYSQTINLKGLVECQRQHPIWGNYAKELLDDGKFLWPRNGKREDDEKKEHPPIHPVKLATKDAHGFTVDEWRIYELIVRHFLACCSKDAVGFETTIKIDIAKESFEAKGLIIRENNWLGIYHPYEKWTEKTLPTFVQHEKFLPKALLLEGSRTKPPNLLTENELITLMDQNGIGTDATIHEQIKAIQENQYVEKKGIYIRPTKLGNCLFEIHESTKTELLKPALRAIMESNLKEISNGKMKKEEFLNNYLDQMAQVFRQMKEGENEILEVMKKYYDETDQENFEKNDFYELVLQEYQPLK